MPVVLHLFPGACDLWVVRKQLAPLPRDSLRLLAGVDIIVLAIREEPSRARMRQVILEGFECGRGVKFVVVATNASYARENGLLIQTPPICVAVCGPERLPRREAFTLLDKIL